MFLANSVISVIADLSIFRWHSTYCNTLPEYGLSIRQPRVGFGVHVCYHCRISPPSFLAECHKRRLNQGSFVLLFFRLYTLSDLYLVFACLFSCTVFVLSFCVYFRVLLCLSVSVNVKWLAVKTASEMTYIVLGGALNSTHSLSICHTHAPC